MNKECVAQKHYSKIQWSPEFNNAAIVEYTAAIPEAKQNQQFLPFYILFHKLISVRVAVAAINISIFLFSK
jgi:hypothetical protein